MVTGNTVIDALFMIRDKIAENASFRNKIEGKLIPLLVILEQQALYPSHWAST